MTIAFIVPIHRPAAPALINLRPHIAPLILTNETLSGHQTADVNRFVGSMSPKPSSFNCQPGSSK